MKNKKAGDIDLLFILIGLALVCFVLFVLGPWIGAGLQTKENIAMANAGWEQVVIEKTNEVGKVSYIRVWHKSGK
jgi:hypothetical protein